MLQVLESGVVFRLAIFAPRRKGKTWFVLRDLALAAIAHDYLPVYASLWRSPDTPQVAIAEALDAALAEIKKARIPWEEYRSKLSSASISVLGVGGGFGIVRPTAPSS